MWISTAAYLRNKEDEIKLRTERDAAVALAKQQETTLAWFMHRLTQVEQERARLIFNYTGVKVESPTYEPEPSTEGKQTMAAQLNANPLNNLPNFSDVGDEEARRLGLDWDADGNLIFGATQ
jgi:hypothetical protein